MPLRPRRPLRRITLAAELEAWAIDFEAGVSWSTNEEVRDAWRRLGAEYLHRRDPRDWGQPEPWALTEFGPPG